MKTPMTEPPGCDPSGGATPGTPVPPPPTRPAGEPALHPPERPVSLEALWLSEAEPALFLRIVCPRAPDAILVLIHGSMVHSEYYLPIAVALAERGIAVALPDLRGHGRSEGRRGHAVRTQEHVADTVRILRKAQALFPDVPLAAGGESYGGLIAYLAAATAPEGVALRALVISAPAFALRARPTPPLMAWLRRLARIMPGVYLPVRLNLAGVSSRPDVETISERDPLIVHQYTLGFYVGLVDAQEQAQEQARTGRLPPTLALLGGQDRVTDNRVTEELLGCLPGSHVRTYPDDLHGVLGEDPPRTAADIAGFLAQVLRERHTAP